MGGASVSPAMISTPPRLLLSTPYTQHHVERAMCINSRILCHRLTMTKIEDVAARMINCSLPPRNQLQAFTFQPEICTLIF